MRGKLFRTGYGFSLEKKLLEERERSLAANLSVQHIQTSFSKGSAKAAD